MRTAFVEQRLTEIWETSKSLSGKLSSVAHKETGVRYVVTAVVLPYARGVEALILRIQLASPDQLILTPAIYDQMFLVGGFTIFWCGSPIVSGFREGARCRGDSGRVPCGCGIHEPAGCFVLSGDWSRQYARGPAKHRSQRLRRAPHRLVGAPLYISSRNHRRGQAAEFVGELGPLAQNPQSIEPTWTCRP